MNWKCKNTFELNKACFEWFEVQNAHLSPRRLDLSVVMVKCILQL